LRMTRDSKHLESFPALIPLENGHEQQFEVPKGNKPAYFYFYAHPGLPSTIHITASGQKITMLANKQTFRIGSVKKSDLKVSMPETAQFRSNNGSASVDFADMSIPIEDMDHNKTTTIITVAVYFSAVDTEIADNQFTIFASSQMIRISSGTPYLGTVEYDRYVYFYINVPESCSLLLISVTSVDGGDTDLVVSKFIKSRPTIKNHHFASISQQKTEFLRINKFNTSGEEIEGTWVIGVYGRTQSRFILTVRNEDSKWVHLESQLPFESSLRENSTLYFTFYHNIFSSYTLIEVQKLSGDFLESVFTLRGGGDVVPHSPEIEGDVKPGYHHYYYYPKSNDKDYLIFGAIHARTASKFSLIIRPVRFY